MSSVGIVTDFSTRGFSARLQQDAASSASAAIRGVATDGKASRKSEKRTESRIHGMHGSIPAVRVNLQWLENWSAVETFSGHSGIVKAEGNASLALVRADVRLWRQNRHARACQILRKASSRKSLSGFSLH